MKPNLNKIAKELYGKIQTRFTDIEIGDENAEVLSKKEDIPLARFFEFEYKERGTPVGTITITLDEEDGIVVQVSGNIAEKKHPGAYRFIRSFRQFAKNRLLNFDVQNIGKNNLDKRDYTFQAKKKELPMMEPIMENRLYGTARMSYQDLGEAKLIIKHSQPINLDLAAGRSMHIENIWVENAQGERFRYPAKHINGARALAEHIKHGGHPYDSIGQHIISLSEELAQLRKFKGYVSRNEALSEAMGDITSKVLERIEQVKKEVNNLQRTAYYEQFAEAFTDREEQMIPEDVMSDWIDRLTIRTFNEELKTAFPYIFRLVDESDIPIKEISPDDLLDEERTETKDEKGNVVSWREEGEWKKAGKKDGRGKVTNMSDKARRETEKLSKKEKELAEAEDAVSTGKIVPRISPPPITAPQAQPTAGEQDLGNDFVLTTVDINSEEMPAVLDKTTQAYSLFNKRPDGSPILKSPYIIVTNGKPTAVEQVGPDTTKALQQMKASQQPKASTSFIKDYQTGEYLTKGPDGKLYNKAGEERDNLHGGPVNNGAAMFRGLQPKAKTMEDQFESFMDSIVNEDEDGQEGRGILDKNESTVLDSVKQLNDIFKTELKGGVAGINIIDTLKDLIPDPEFLSKMKDVDPDLDARSVIELELKDMARNHEDLARAVSLLDFGGASDEEIGGDDTEEAPPAPDASAVPPAPDASAVPPAPDASAVPPAPDASAVPPTSPEGAPPVREGMGNMAGLKAKLIKALEAGATLETKLDFGFKVMTLGEACDACGIETDKPEASGDPIHSILKSIAGFWNPKEKNFTIGGTRAKIKVLKGFKDGDFPHSEPEHVKRVIDMIEKMDPTKNDELGRIKQLSGTMQVEDVQDDFDAMMKDFTEKHGDVDVNDMLAKFKQDNPPAPVAPASTAAMPKFDINDPQGMQNHFKNFASQVMPQVGQKIQAATAGQKPQNINMPGFNGSFNPADFGNHIGNMMKGMKLNEAQELANMLKIAGIGK